MIESKSTSFSAMAVSGCWLGCWVGSKGAALARWSKKRARRSVTDCPLEVLLARAFTVRVHVWSGAVRATPPARGGRSRQRFKDLAAPPDLFFIEDANIPGISMSRARWVAEDGQSLLCGEWLEAPQRCLAACCGSRDGRCDCWMRSSIVHVGCDVPVQAARGQVGCARRAGRKARWWPEPFEWDAASDFTAWGFVETGPCCGRRRGGAHDGRNRLPG
jgi:hypothetical protein